MAKKPTIGITLGDPAGIGPEVVAKALQAKGLPARADYVIFEGKGDRRRIKAGFPTPLSAQVALQALEDAVAAWRAGEIDAIVTGPVSKENMREVGFDFPGQTEYFAAACGVKPEHAVMMMYDPKLTVALASTHCSLREALKKLSPARLIRTTQAAAAFFAPLLQRRPRLAVAGVNPHNGEGGLFGDEEARIVTPAVERLQSADLDVTGPHSPDTVFHHAAEGRYDAVICAYHDQGLIPFKLLAFSTGVNVTLGLPLIRTSPDHGTAYSLAGQGVADHRSMAAAIKLAVRLAK